MQSRDQESFAQLKLLHTIILYNFEKNSTNFAWIACIEINAITMKWAIMTMNSAAAAKKLNKINGSKQKKKNYEKLLFPFNSYCFHIWNKTKVGKIINWMIYQVILNDKTHYTARAQTYDKRKGEAEAPRLYWCWMKEKLKFHICIIRACEKEYVRKRCSGEKELNISFFFPSLFVAH